MRIDPHAAGLYVLLDPDLEERTRHAGRLVLLPLVGWPMVLGYRRALAKRFFDRSGTALPPWRGSHRAYLLHGLRAIGVIHVYLAPLWLVLGTLASTRGYAPGAGTALAVAGLAALPILSSLVFPILVAAASVTGPGGAPLLEPLEATALVLGFHVAIALVPAGFVRVTETDRFRSAFALTHTLPFIARNARAYPRAWWYGLWMNGAALVVFPLRPSALFWAYVSSQAVFNQLLETPEDAREPRVWLARARRLTPTLGTKFGRTECATPRGGTVRVLRTPFFSAPLPGRGDQSSLGA